MFSCDKIYFLILCGALQNELQIQTIGHLQNAVVEAKRNLDQMTHKAMSDVSELRPTISSSAFSHRNVHDV